jgi:hypothetical protein
MIEMQIRDYLPMTISFSNSLISERNLCWRINIFGAFYSAAIALYFALYLLYSFTISN